MSLKNFTALLAFFVYWLKLVIGGIAFLRGNFDVAGLVLLIGSALEIALYAYTMKR